MSEPEHLGWFTPGSDKPTPNSRRVYGVERKAPINYAKVDGSLGKLDYSYEEDWPYPRYIYVDGVLSRFEEIPDSADNSRWGEYGWHLTPRTHFGVFVARIAEGLSLHYPWPAVIMFAWRYRKNAPRKKVWERWKNDRGAHL